ncbi:hydrolase, TatD family [Bacteriovorax sp. BAL6_X]|uniref:TatD family hydrolase n=1 Tax=Bacteriovorax sp. BAL6_X TaxID=1201290 RepID=UPI0003867486|nr:TatD family hydrolase [Bacteriovorax sp. BAL6_X]EPZ50654.1 hydrolase, TatD family [Bacteriovorax sp. BAL6_X]
MTSKESESAKFIDLHGHSRPNKTAPIEDFCIYSYSPQINDLPQAGQFFSAGVHPWRLSGAKESFEQVKKLSHMELCLMIGEAGLDRAIDTDLKKQEKVFSWHIELANQLNKPLIIHNVRCLSEIFRLHKSYPGHTPWVLHDFNGTLSDMNNSHERRIYTSLGPRFFESSNAKISSTILNNKVDLEYIFFETDDRRDLKVSAIYREFAIRQELELTELKEQIWHNLVHLLGKSLRT